MVESVADRDGEQTAIELEMIDSEGPFGQGTLDELCRTFLGRGGPRRPPRARATAESPRDRPRRPYAGGIEAAAPTLQLVEAMRREHRKVFATLSVGPAATLAMGASPGRRGANLLRVPAARHVAASAQLSSPVEFRELLRRGGRGHLGVVPSSGRFSAQTASCHGRLLFRRTPGRFWPEAPGMIRAGDGKRYSNQITRGLNVYFGEPLVLELGQRRVTLGAAVALLAANGPRDGWFVRATGNVTGWENTPVPSTVGASTHANWRRQHARRPHEPGSDLQGQFYTHRIESRVVTADIWDVIRCLPEEFRRCSEGLVVSIVCHPGRLIVDVVA